MLPNKENCLVLVAPMYYRGPINHLATLHIPYEVKTELRLPQHSVVRCGVREYVVNTDQTNCSGVSVCYPAYSLER